MCGIAGILGPRADETSARKMIAAISHRGPDGEQVKALPLGVLAHRRLSIIDLSDGGTQPMTSADGRFTITFNGELYNYKELKAELTSYPFKSGSDTEVILAAWTAWGETALERFLGMFAFAITDAKEGTVTLVRDRLGIKPLFYAIRHNCLYFASEIKALRAAGIPMKPNDRAISTYLLHGYYDHSEETFYDGVLHLRGGHLLRWKDGAAEIARWWYLPDRVGEITSLTDGECIDAFRALFDHSVGIHLRSDVPVGVNLSSGIDSLSLFYELKRITDPKKLEVFSMGFADPVYDETKDIASIVAAEGVPFHRVEIGPEDYEKFLKPTVVALDQPFGGLSTIAYYKLMTLPRTRGIKVLLEGQGVDEILGGYNYFLGPLYRDYFARGDWRSIYDEVRRVGFSTFRKTMRKTDRPVFQDGSSYIKTNCLRREWMDRAQNVEPPTFEAPFKSQLSNALYRDTMFTKLPRVMRFNDHLSMAFGLELRVPYLDHRIVELAFSLGDRWKMRNGVTKVMLREAMKGAVPEELRTRSKRPQSSPQTPWFKTALAENVLADIRGGRFKNLPMVNAAETEREFRSFLKDPSQTNSFFFWQLVNLSYWYEQFT